MIQKKLLKISKKSLWATFGVLGRAINFSMITRQRRVCSLGSITPPIIKIWTSACQTYLVTLYMHTNDMRKSNQILHSEQTTTILLLYAVTHAPFHAPVLRPTSWPNARDRRD